MGKFNYLVLLLSVLCGLATFVSATPILAKSIDSDGSDSIYPVDRQVDTDSSDKDLSGFKKVSRPINVDGITYREITEGRVSPTKFAKVYVNRNTPDCAVQGTITKLDDAHLIKRWVENEISCQYECKYRKECVVYGYTSLSVKSVGGNCHVYTLPLMPDVAKNEFTHNVVLGHTGWFYSDAHTRDGTNICYSIAPFRAAVEPRDDIANLSDIISIRYQKPHKLDFCAISTDFSSSVPVKILPHCNLQGMANTEPSGALNRVYYFPTVVQCQSFCRYSVGNKYQSFSFHPQTAENMAANCAIYQEAIDGKVTTSTSGVYFSNRYPGDGTDYCYGDSNGLDGQTSLVMKVGLPIAITLAVLYFAIPRLWRYFPRAWKYVNCKTRRR